MQLTGSKIALRRAAYAAGAATNSKAVGHCRRLCVRPYSAVFREGNVWVPNRLGGETPTSCPPHARDQGFRSDERSIGSARSASSGFFAGGGTTPVGRRLLSQRQRGIGAASG